MHSSNSEPKKTPLPEPIVQQRGNFNFLPQPSATPPRPHLDGLVLRQSVELDRETAIACPCRIAAGFMTRQLITSLFGFEVSGFSRNKVENQRSLQNPL
jgi:hypothetical protein